MSSLYGRSVEINLTELDFPFLSTDLARGAVIKDVPDQQSIGKFGGAQQPQLIYAKNVLPTRYGYSSVDQFPVVEAIPTRTDFQHYTTITTLDGSDYVIAKLDNGIGFTRTAADAWHYIVVSGMTANTDFTRGFLRGVHYFFFEQIGVFTFNYLTNPATLVAHPTTFPAGESAAMLRGMTAVSGYLIGWTDSTVYWSDPANPSNFVPAIGGSDRVAVQALRGKIVTILPLANGFLIYSDKNVVGAQYTGNPNAPWTFREVPGSAGIRNQYNVAWTSNLTAHYAWTYSGLQEVSFTKAQNAWPFLTDFLNKNNRETFDFMAGLVTTTGAAISAVKLEMIGHRYVGISYGPLVSSGIQKFDEALIYDIDLERWGKIVVSHTSLLNFNVDVQALWQSYSDIDASATRTYASLANVKYQELTKSNGALAILTSNIGSGDEFGNAHFYLRANVNVPIISGSFQSQLVFGRIAFNKTQMTQFHQVEVQNVFYVGNVALYASMTADPFQDSGATLQHVPLFQRDASVNVRRFQGRKTAKSFGFALEGNFEITNQIFQIQLAGKR